MSASRRPDGRQRHRWDGIDMREDDRLTPEEKVAFQRLPREIEPSDLLEERVVRSLRDEGLLRPRAVSRPHPGAGRPSGGTGPGGRGFWLRPWVAAGSLAASLALFFSGLAVGQWMGARNTTEVFLAVREQDASQLALRIQEAGSAFVAALAALSEMKGASSQEERQAETDPLLAGFDAGQEVAMGALFGAALELARMAPGDADILRVIQILEDRKAREEGREELATNVIWF